MSELARYDAIVVGGGPAGSSCAARLVQGGAKVAILDREEFPRTKLCAEWVTPEAMADLELAPADYRRRARRPAGAWRARCTTGNAAVHGAHRGRTSRCLFCTPIASALRRPVPGDVGRMLFVACRTEGKQGAAERLAMLPFIGSIKFCGVKLAQGTA